MSKNKVLAAVVALALLCAAPPVQAQSQTAPSPRPSTQAPAGSSQSTSATTVPGSTADFNAAGDMASSAIVGAAVKNPQGETVGTIDEVYIDANGNLRSAIIAVGGLLGVGAHHVEVPWKDLKLSRDQDKLLVQMAATKDSLKAMPEFKYQRRQVR